ncbi:ROK family glucokinase [Schleiferilactobacillus perolens]|jgi:glucokinase|uniref:Glucokinase n=1 Tax=Schleiferilactobacillus perolens DSM 12744 TaxID=1423792 RepID=A0A0R1MXF0_9LACO|nr:ROK family glucokinase [Schleiferilactobacillus perolens]KRL12910.1 glk protein [Schleiferilactobacillus perolens DSM 12744]MCI1892101.1 ROK family glucokinase [Schleiferilactobacillus harbinensis]MCI1913980.1 ROK family glucokinase [Schleiferilactobacillus harbinensis]MCI2171874.1 ROK family glucokinase [Schleiferilactobacillus perolens]
MDDKKLIGIDLGGTTTKFAIITPAGEVQQRWSIETDILEDGQHIIPNIIDSINHHLDLYQMKSEQFIGIGMGSPGSVDLAAGTVSGAYNLNWEGTVYPKRDIEAATHIDFKIDNDANVAALGERWQGAGDNDPDVTFVTLGTGVGGGVIADGHLLHGVAGSAGELGHITVQPGGYLCTCGKRGCLEQYASATGVVHIARDMAEEYSGDAQLKFMVDDGQDVSSKTVFDLAKDNDPLASKVVDRVCFYLGLALANVGNMLNPKYIVIGGGVSAAGDILLNGVQKYFEENTFPNVRHTTALRLATLGNEAGVIGAASLVLQDQQE